jgi:cysteine desulfurase
LGFGLWAFGIFFRGVPFFDHNATTPLAPVAREAWLKAQDEAWQNPSSPYRASAQVGIRLDAAREKLAILMGGRAEDYVFTSGATESANLVLAHWARTLPPDARIAVNPTEHPCVRDAARHFFGGRVVWLKTSADGVVSPAEVAAVVGNVGAVAVMAANNETGVIQPWAEIARACVVAGVPYLCDASQWLGKLPAGGLGDVGFVIGAAHKFGGPKGAGFLKLGAQAEGLRGQLGGGQERGHRGGTEDFPGIAAMVAALADAEQKKVFQETERLRWRADFERAVAAAVPGARVVAAGADRLWNTVSLLMPFADNTRWVARLDKRGFQVSTGSACSTGKNEPSHVLAAMGLPPETARRAIRVSADWETTEADWNMLAVAFSEVSAELKATEGNVVSL